VSLSAFKTAGMQANAFADTGTLGGGLVESGCAGQAGARPNGLSHGSRPVDSDEVSGAAQSVTMRHIRLLCI
jgi:hypothetical protein